jgi:hypothetical protein
LNLITNNSQKNNSQTPVICPEDFDKRGYREIDATSGKYIIKLRKRISSADAILPHADEQYKYSEALQSGYPVHKDKTGKLGIDTVEDEIVKVGAERLVIVTPKNSKEIFQKIVQL